MKNFKSIALGFVAGSLCMVTVTAFASYMDITAKVMNDLIFKVDGAKMASPSDQPVLNYNGYTYVPMRYMTEVMGGTIDWDIANRIIDVQTDKKTYIKEVEVEKIVYVEKDSTDSTTAVYSKLPIKQHVNGKIVEVNGISIGGYNSALGIQTNISRVFVSIDNESINRVQLVASASKLTVDGEEIAISISQQDPTWVSGDIEVGAYKEGYIEFGKFDEKFDRATLELFIRDQTTNQVESVIFNINSNN